MNQEQQRFAIAFALGAKWHDIPQNNNFAYWPKRLFCFGDVPTTPQFVMPFANNSGDAIYGIPDYLHDLNAMHEAEKVLSIAEAGTYADTLHTICMRSPNHWRETSTWHATAAQRAEAFLRTLNLWTD